MKVLIKFLTYALTFGLLAGCNKHTESLDNKAGIADEGEAVYMSLRLKLPSDKPGSRTATGETTTEPGKDYENKVRSLLLVVADQNDNYIVHSYSGRVTTDNSVTAAVDKTQLGTYYTNHAETRAGEDIILEESARNIRLYVYCNPPQDLLNDFNDEGKRDDWKNFSCKVDEKNSSRSDEKEEGAVDGNNQSIWAGNSFLMSNVALYDAKLPQKYSDWEEFATLSKPFKLTGGDGNIDKPTVDPIEVERSVARFDFKDGSPTGTPANTYEIISTGASNGKLQVELVRMSLVNMSNSFYYLKRVTTNEETGSDPILCGEEDIDNWVIDTDWKERHKTQKIEGEVVESLKNFYNFRLFDEKGNIEESTRSAWNNHRIENVLSSSDNGNGYRIWRYVTENTIPGEMHQKNAISTGIVFKGLLRAVETGTGAVNEDLWKAISGTYDIKQIDGKPIGYVSTLTYKDEQGNDVTKSYPILYLFNDVLYVGWNHQIHEALVDNEGSPLADAAYKSFPDEGLPETVDAYYQKVVEESNKVPQNEAALSAALVNFRKAATKAGFTLYNASVDEGSGEGDKSFGAGYYCYYYYWNRHNDNGRPGTMGKMEFAVVRNNIYKLSVDNINYLGHPRRSDNDPEPPTPDSNDEEAKVYLQVSVEVRPWTVRMNSIEF